MFWCKRQQCHIPGLLDRKCKLSLVLGAATSLTTRPDFAAARHIVSKERDFFIVDRRALTPYAALRAASGFFVSLKATTSLSWLLLRISPFVLIIILEQIKYLLSRLNRSGTCAD